MLSKQPDAGIVIQKAGQFQLLGNLEKEPILLTDLKQALASKQLTLLNLPQQLLFMPGKVTPLLILNTQPFMGHLSELLTPLPSGSQPSPVIGFDLQKNPASRLVMILIGIFGVLAFFGLFDFSTMLFEGSLDRIIQLAKLPVVLLAVACGGYLWRNKVPPFESIVLALCYPGWYWLVASRSVNTSTNGCPVIN